MAIKIIYYNIIIPINNLEKSKELKNLKNTINFCLERNRKNVWHDDDLFTIGGIMSPADVEREVATFEQLGLNAFKEINGNKHWHDLCVVNFIDGATLPCSWLKVRSNPHSISYAWLKGKEPGVIVQPTILK